MKHKCVAVLTAVMLAYAAPSWSTDAASALVDCDALTKAAKDAQLKDIAIHTPRVNPVQTFDDAISSCLDNISRFDMGLRMPGLGDLDALLTDMAAKLMQRACQTATNQFNTAVNDAKNSVNGVAAGATGGIVTSPVLTGYNGTGVGTVSSDNGTTVKNTVNNATNRVINTLLP